MTAVRSRFARAAIVIFLSIAGCVIARADEALARRVDGIINAPDFKHAQWGLLVVDLDSGTSLFELAADKLFAPASTTKLYSVAAALDELGADYRFETPIYARGTIDDKGRLQGDLILVASGDLSMGGRTDAEGHIVFVDSDHTYANFSRTAELTPVDPLAGIDELAKQVAAAGIKHVTGDVVIDDRLFEAAHSTGSGPERLSPIMVNDNVVDVRVTPTSPGMPATIEWRPKTAAVRIDAHVDTVAADGKTRVDLDSISDGLVVVRGQIPAGAKPVVRIYEVPDAASFARSLLIESLGRAGVSIDSSPLGSNDAAKLPRRRNYTNNKQVALLKSPRFAESAKLILKVSHNLQASTLPLLLAARHDEHTLAAGLKRQHAFLARAGVDVDTISFGGGAGGDRADYVSPRATVQLLRYMSTRPDFETYREALPVLGVDGTLAGAVDKNSAAAGKVQAKTGTLLWDNVMNGTSLLTSKALAGYTTTPAGKRLAFAMFVNNVQLAKADDRERVGKVLGKLCEAMYESL